MVFSTQNMISPENKQTNKQTNTQTSKQTNKQTKQNNTTVNRTGPPQGFKTTTKTTKTKQTNQLTQPILSNLWARFVVVTSEWLLEGRLQLKDDVTGHKTYLASCDASGVTASSYFIKHIENKEVVMRFHGLGPVGTKALCVPLRVRRSAYLSG